MVQGSGSRLQSLGFWVLGFRVCVLGVRVWVLGFGV